MSGGLSTNDTAGLQKKVFINLMLQFGSKKTGRVIQFEKDSFVGVNIAGKMYIKKAFIEMEKNNRNRHVYFHM